jgi:major membrane immunogen (membrane-anchored lipoprotein)
MGLYLHNKPMKRFITCLCMLVLMTGCAAKAPISSPKVPMNTYKTTDVTFHTNKGDMTLAIETERVPNIAANFVNLAKAGKYDNTIFSPCHC